ncbi:MAG: DUF4832 domain-containing protein [Chloroflexi bacterium]|nr:DUF4832 domain-containing protein [Chloroflexota bacterium]
MKRNVVFTRTLLLSVLGLVTLILAGGIIVLANNLNHRSIIKATPTVQKSNHQEADQPVLQADTTFTPPIISPSDAEIGNPMRGAQYYGDEAPPPHWPLTDRYKRWCWSKLEPLEGQYNFALIDAEIAKAKAAGYTFGWRIMPVTPEGGCLPDYLNGVNYDDPLYLTRAQALITALGQRYDSNPAVGLLDMSLYGCWGEWNESCGGTMSVINRQKLIDMQFQAFPHKRFLMLTDHRDSLDYALNYQRPLRTGVRIDCLGTNMLGGARSKLENDSTALNQWKIAPMYFEYCNGPNFSLALQDIKKYHASLIGDGDNNLQAFGDYSQSDQDILMRNFKASGYRFELNSLSVPHQLRTGVSFGVTSQWTNVNTAPAYLPWNVLIQLRTGGTITWQDKSQLDLQQPFSDASQGNDTHITIDTFKLPEGIAHGNYQACVQIVDPNHVYAPLALANTGRQSDGSYCVGSVSIQ